MTRPPQTTPRTTRPGRTVRQAVCADIGSTYTKVALVDIAAGRLLAGAEHRTTIDTDVLHGLDAAVAATGAPAGTPWYVCSSAGGGLRLAVVGHEELVTAEAGRQVALSAGARVVHVSAGRLDRSGLAAVRESGPDVLLLVGGTDGGDADTLVHNAARLAAARLRLPVVVAGNRDARDRVVTVLTSRSVPAIPTGNVLPRIGALAPAPARAAIREVFLRHVIGGKRLSRGPRLGRLLRGATPDVVLAAAELLADDTGEDLLVVDVGGATTDVYSAVAPDPDAPASPGEVAGSLSRARTVEGDLGVRWSAPSVVRAAAAERLLDPHLHRLLRAAADHRATTDPVPDTATEHRHDRDLARLAATVALRRHARGEHTSSRRGRDLRRVRAVVGSGGVWRHTTAPDALLAEALDDPDGTWPRPRAATITIDRDYVLAAAGLLAAEHPEAARALVRRLVGLGG